MADMLGTQERFPASIPNMSPVPGGQARGHARTDDWLSCDVNRIRRWAALTAYSEIKSLRVDTRVYE